MSQDEQSTKPHRGVDGFSDDDSDYLLPEQAASEETVTRTKKRSRRAFAIMAGLLGLVLLVIAGFVVSYLKAANDALNDMHREQMLPQTTRPTSPKTTTNDPLNMLIMGSDSRGSDQGRSDVLIMVHIPTDRKQIYLISLPRDTWVNVPGHGEAKINAAYAWGGMPLTIETVEDLTGSYIEHAAIINFEGFVGAINAIGGIDVYNSTPSQTNNYTFPEGTIHLDGEAALVFTRERYDLPNGDLDRARRQRDVVIAVVKKMLTPEVLADPSKFSSVLTTLAPYFTVDEGFTSKEITKLALSMRITGGDALRSLQAPLAGFATSDDGQSIDLIDEPTMKELNEALQNDTMDAYWQAHRNDPPVRDR